MKKFIFQSFSIVAGAALLIQPIAPVKAIAAQNFTRSRIDRYPENLPHGLALADVEQQSDDRSGLLPKMLTARRMEGGSGGGSPVGRGRINTPSQSPKSSNIPVRNVYSSLRKSPNFPRGFRAAPNGIQKVEINHRELLRELRKIEPRKWYKVYRDGYVGNNKVSIHYFESATRRVFDVKTKDGWSVLR
ncbi:hypothetical protein [Chamaesiphon polymorphus]|uniref:Uncharacterized protein n=1 Tax=Chamaesiphon polymorphus CCALA 037 TaxID=2107692 RepID=A0A2T1GF46_9CYAN|nr:hypothetical protein [Chamaesiphon polymorphus]PSB56204.1 hypothetical protein C7B77_12615 [Chamaesiphon polymorphus CCALA 037]